MCFVIDSVAQASVYTTVQTETSSQWKTYHLRRKKKKKTAQLSENMWMT